MSAKGNEPKKAFSSCEESHICGGKIRGLEQEIMRRPTTLGEVGGPRRWSLTEGEPR